MTDEEIIALYFDRSEEAIAATQGKYDGYCRSIIGRILGSPRDGEETVSDTWLRAWLSIPPNRPRDLKLYLAKIGRNLALNRLREGRAAKRGDGADAVLEELSEVLGGSTTEALVDAKELQGAVTASAITAAAAMIAFRMGNFRMALRSERLSRSSSMPPKASNRSYLFIDNPP